MDVKNILAFDVGTTSMKCILFNEKFEEIFCENKEYSIETYADGIAELDAEVYFDAFCKCVGSIGENSISLSEIDAVCFTTQGETLIPVDKHGVPLTKAIVWLDSRAGKEAEFIKNRLSVQEIYSSTGLCDIDGALPMAKVLWLYNNRPEIYNSTYKFLLLEDYLILRLTGKMVSEKSIQSSSGWYDIVNEQLFGKMIDVCNVDSDKFPTILPCRTIAGNVCESIEKSLGLSQKTIVVTGAMDQIASAIGSGNIKEGIVTETTGTALVLGATVSKPKFDINLPLTVYKHYDDKFIYMPYSATAGIVLKWFRDTLMPEIVTEAEKRQVSSYKLIDEIAEKSPVGSNGVIMNPEFTSGGAFNGLTLSTSIADMARSVLEGIAYMLRDLVEQVELHEIKVDEILSLGGGSYSKLWATIKASVCEKRINCVRYSQTTALGAAILASVALGSYASVENAVISIKSKGYSYEPCSDDSAIYRECYTKYKKYKSI